ncbi:MAG: formylglycine-generating enzyme family protein [Myxococcota bacterium]|nr:formylglycine-generating enzyme family protein [Myxococcota bacterium]
MGIPAGTFTMGCTAGQSSCQPDESPAHEVTLTRTFWLSETEVTQSEYQALMGSNPSHFSGCADCPVERVNWFEALAYANALSVSEGLAPCFDISGVESGSTVTVLSSSGNVYDCVGYRLPTEAEWEYAARAGTDLLYAGSNDAGSVAWYSSNSSYQTHSVATKASNAFVLYDMSGNVWEWCWDWYDAGYYVPSPSSDPDGPAGLASNRVLRGGGWYYSASYLRAANRDGSEPGSRNNYLGFRLARSVP